MSDRATKVKEAIEYLQHYVGTYDKQQCYLDYSDETIIDDILYGLGVALGEEYKYADGYARFEARLIKHLTEK